MRGTDAVPLILIIDDETSSLRMLSAALRRAGYAVETAENGLDGISTAVAGIPDLVLLDVFMAELDGVAVCKILKETPETRKIPIICMTGSADVETKMSCLQAGANDFLAKPIDPVELTVRIGNLLVIKQYEMAEDQNRILTASRDLTEQLRQEWEDTFDSLEDIITIHDRDYNIIRANKKARDLLGLAPGDIGGNKCFLFYHRTEVPPQGCPTAASIEKGVISSVEMFEPCLNKFVEVRVIPRLDQAGKVTGYIHIVRDITATKKTQASLEKAYNELKDAQSFLLQQEKMASIGQLAAGVAHEINNPTGFIMSNLGSLQRYMGRIGEFLKVQEDALGKLPHEEQDRVRAKRKELKVDLILGDVGNLVSESLEGAERIKKIVQDLKCFSRVDESEQKLADINAGIESTLNIVWNELKYKATVKKAYGDIPQTKCNPGQLNQVFMNILVNAAHAIDRQGEIGIRTWSEGNSIHVSIADTGCGIPAEKLGRIFEPFYTTKEVGKGTGLGLSIAYDIVKKHSGEILVESEVGRGTVFTIVIPAVEMVKHGQPQ